MTGDSDGRPVNWAAEARQEQYQSLVETILGGSGGLSKSSNKPHNPY